MRENNTKLESMVTGKEISLLHVRFIWLLSLLQKVFQRLGYRKLTSASYKTRYCYFRATDTTASPGLHWWQQGLYSGLRAV